MTTEPVSGEGTATAAVRAQWNQMAKGWCDSSFVIRPWLQEATQAMLGMAGVKSGCRVLDIAAGAGDQTLDIAERVGPQGYVLATDLSPDILKFAAQQAVAAGYRNIETRVSDDERLQVKDAQFDAAVCRLGLMLFNDPLQGLREIARVLKPDGGGCTIVFGAPQAVTAVIQARGLATARSAPVRRPPKPRQARHADDLRARPNNETCGVRIMASMSAVSQTRPGRASSRSGHVRYAAESGSKFRSLVTQRRLTRVDGAARDVIQAPKPQPRIMRYALSDYEWTAIKPILPNKPRGFRRRK